MNREGSAPPAGESAAGGPSAGKGAGLASDAAGGERAGGQPSGAATVDLHAHSTASDGAASPSDLVRRAKHAGLVAVALTDHDTVEGVAEARLAGVVAGVHVIAGVELSAVDGEQEVHILGLHLDDTRALAPILLELRDARRQRAAAIVTALQGVGVALTIEAVMAEAGGGAVGRPHVARALIAGGWVRDQREAFDRFLGGGRPAFVAKRRLALEDAIHLLHAAGGLAVYAHPGRDGVRSRLEALQGMGLDGVEVLHPSHSAEDIARLRALSDFLQLVPSGGSDWHGGTEGARTLGGMRVPASWVDRQVERVQAYRGGGGSGEGGAGGNGGFRSGSWSSAIVSRS